MKQLKVIIITTIVFIFCGVGLVYVSAPLYRSTFEVMIERGLAYNMLRDDPQAFNEFIKYQKELIMSPGVLQKTIKELHLDLSERFSGRDIQKELLKHIGIEIVGTSLIKVSVYSDEPIFSIRLAQALADNYVNAIDKEKYKISDDMKKWILETSNLSQQISAKEKEIEDTKAGQNIDLIERGTAAIQTNIAKLERQKEKLQKSIPQLEAEYEKVRVYEGLSPQEAVEIINWPSFNALKREYRELEIKKEDLSRIYTDEHPEMMELKEKENDLLSRIQTFLNASTKGKLIEINKAKRKIAAIDKAIEQQKSKLQGEVMRTQEIYIGEEEIESLKKTYADLMEKLEQQGYFPIGVTVLGLTPEDLTPAVEHKDYRAALIVSGGLGIFVGLLIGWFRKRKIQG